jgi:hypothetical protein
VYTQQLLLDGKSTRLIEDLKIQIWLGKMQLVLSTKVKLLFSMSKKFMFGNERIKTTLTHLRQNIVKSRRLKNNNS